MNKKLRKLLERLQDHDYVCMFGSSPRLLLDLIHKDLEVCMTDRGDYVKSSDVILRLRQLADLLEEIELEVQ